MKQTRDEMKKGRRKKQKEKENNKRYRDSEMGC
jgi:hypothetical protein